MDGRILSLYPYNEFWKVTLCWLRNETLHHWDGDLRYIGSLKAQVELGEKAPKQFSPKESSFGFLYPNMCIIVVSEEETK